MGLGRMVHGSGEGRKVTGSIIDSSEHDHLVFPIDADAHSRSPINLLGVWVLIMWRWRCFMAKTYPTESVQDPLSARVIPMYPWGPMSRPLAKP